MSAEIETSTPIIDDATRSRVARNLELARRLTLTIVEEPALLDQIPDGGTIILLPEDDPELAEANLRSGRRLVRAGRDVTFRHLPARVLLAEPAPEDAAVDASVTAP